MSGTAPHSRRRGDEARAEEAAAEQVADVMFALSTPSRVQILMRLMNGPRSVSELLDELGLEQSAVSHQLRVLREHELVRVDRVGRRRVYNLADDDVSGLLAHALRRVARRGSLGPRLRGAAPGR